MREKSTNSEGIKEITKRYHEKFFLPIYLQTLLKWKHSEKVIKKKKTQENVTERFRDLNEHLRN